MRSVLALTSVVAVAAFGALAAPVAQAQDINEEVIEQVTRLVTDSVNRRLTGGGGDLQSKTDARGNTVWTAGNVTRITDQEGPDFEVDILQGEFGFDTAFDRFVLGASAGVSRAFVEVDPAATMPPFAVLPAILIGTPFDNSPAITGANDSTSYNFSPYGAYQFNENFFASGVVGYNYTDVDSSSADSHTFFGQLTGNAVLDRDSFRVSGHAGWRAAYSLLENTPGDDDTFTHTFVVGAEAGYKIQPDIMPFVFTSYEHAFIEDGPDNDSVYVGGGIEFIFSDTVSASMVGEVEVADDDTNQFGAGLEVSVKF